MSGRICAVFGCYDSARKLSLWNKTLCEVHNIPHEDCPCLRPYKLHNFPQKTDIRQAWVKAVNRKDYVPSKYSVVCSMHFVDGVPTTTNQIPQIGLGYEKKIVVGRRTINRQRPIASPFKENRKETFGDNSPTSMNVGNDAIPAQETFILVRPIMASQQGGDITTDDITTEEDLFYAAVKEEVDVEMPRRPAFDIARVKGEPVDYGGMSTRDDAFSGNVDVLLPAIEEVLVDPPPVKTEPNNEDCWGCLQLDTEDQVDPLLLPDDVKQEPQTELPFAGTATAQRQTATKPSTTQGHNVVFYTNAQGQDVTGVACNECGKVLATKSGMKRHALSHCGKKLLERSECDPTGENPYACIACDYRTTVGSDLARHLKTHTGEKPYACVECDFRAPSRCRLAAHNNTHTGEKPFACVECDYRTSWRSDLATHKRIHTGEKPFACSECDFRAAQSSHLSTHKMIHTGEKPFACAECDYRTVRSRNLAAHRVIHTGEKPYACAECDYRTVWSTNLAKHKMTHTGEKPFACAECDYRAAERRSLARHKMIHARDRRTLALPLPSFP